MRVGSSAIPQASPRFIALDSLRGISASLVLLFHCATSGRLAVLAPVRGGWVFVDFFFVLSGFVIAANYGDRLRAGLSIKRYMALRLGRVYPLYLFMLLAFLASEVLLLALPQLSERAAFGPDKAPADFVLSLAMLQLFHPFRVTFWNTPGWSVAAEVWTYLLFALLLRWSRRWWLAATGLIAIVAWAVLRAHPAAATEAAFWAMLRAPLGFGLGLIAYAIHRAPWRPTLSPGLATLCEIGACLCVWWVCGRDDPEVMVLVAAPLFAPVVLLLAQEAGLIGQLLRTAPFRLLGTLSYSIYLAHSWVNLRMMDLLRIVGPRLGTGPLIRRMDDGTYVALGGPGAQDVLSLAVLGATIAFSALTWRLIEEPARQWSRRAFAGPVLPR